MRPDPHKPWSVPVTVHDLPAAGRHVDLVADARVRAAVAKAANLRDLARLEASFDLSRQGRDGVHLDGRVSATVGQVCVVTLEPMESEVEETVDLSFSPHVTPLVEEPDAEPARPMQVPEVDTPEPLAGSAIDLGAIATEFLMLGLDPYPRKPGVEFKPSADGDDAVHPFAALAALKTDDSSDNDGNGNDGKDGNGNDGH
jgi:hypothetical protein